MSQANGIHVDAILEPQEASQLASSALPTMNGSKKLSASEKRKLRARAKKLADRAERHVHLFGKCAVTRVLTGSTEGGTKEEAGHVYSQKLQAWIIVNRVLTLYIASCREIRLARETAGASVGSPKKVIMLDISLNKLSCSYCDNFDICFYLLHRRMMQSRLLLSMSQLPENTRIW